MSGSSGSSGDFVQELDLCVQRLEARKRQRQLVYGAASVILALGTLMSCGASGIGLLGLVLFGLGVAAIIYFEWRSGRLTSALEKLPLDGPRVFFVSPDAGLVFANPDRLFIEKDEKVSPYRTPLLELNSASYAEARHELRLQLSLVRQDPKGNETRTAAQRTISFPKELSPDDALEVAKSIDGFIRPAPRASEPARRASR